MNIIVDTGFWIALYNPEKHIELQDDIDTILNFIEDKNIIIPFPTLYEFLNSKFSRKKYVEQFRRLILKPNYMKLDDTIYRMTALESFFNNAVERNNDVSFVDEVIKEVIIGKLIRIDYLVSFDAGLNNFAKARGIETYI